jgi:hypothetical protein
MSESMIDADSLLAVDVGTVTTRAALFDLVEGHYRFISAGQAPSTAAAPQKDLYEGVSQAIENLQIVTGRKFLDEQRGLIVPADAGTGVDIFAATFSAGPPIRTVLVGLKEEVSLASVRRLVRTIYARVIDTIGLDDKRRPEQHIDSLIRLCPDLILVSGGTDGGATQAVRQLIETIGLACHLLPAERRPALLYAGNRNLSEEIKTSLQSLTRPLGISPNIRPDLESENLQPAQFALARLYTQVCQSQMGGVDKLNALAGDTLMPTAYAEGRMIRLLSQVHNQGRGILGVDLGASAATVAAAFGEELTLGVYPQSGPGEDPAGLLRDNNLSEILKWIPLEISPETVREYLYQKSIYPASQPATPEDLSIEQALARQSLSAAFNSLSRDFPQHALRVAPGLAPYFDLILACGSAITHAPTLGQSLLILLDSIQPVGISTIILDRNNLLPALGAAASRKAILSVQILESDAFSGVATVVAPYTSARTGMPILTGRLVYQNGNETRILVNQGALEILPLRVGQSGRLYLQPSVQTDIGLGPGITHKDGLPIAGTELGVVFDARGRPLRLPAETTARRESLAKWSQTLGG